jgi:ABC-type phosphate transport system substrate-binding protein
MDATVKQGTQKVITNYLLLINEMIEKTRKGEQVEWQTLTTLNDSVRVIVSNVNKPLLPGAVEKVW